MKQTDVERRAQGVNKIRMAGTGLAAGFALALFSLAFFSLAFFSLAMVAPGAAQTTPGEARARSPIPKVPGFWRSDKYRPKPKVEEGAQLRFITTADYPPFNYRDESGDLAGFNIELARAICAELKLNCSYEAMDWDELAPTIEARRADAAIASIAINRQSRETLAFTDRYYTTPARFAVPVESRLRDMSPGLMTARKIAVRAGTAHEAYLKDFFTLSEIVAFDTDKAARAALMAGKVDALFGDGITLVYWMNGTNSRGCCRFAGGPYTESHYFGEGVGIAVARDNKRLIQVLNLGLDRIRASGTFEELFVRYFPINLF